jgi:uncharacterized protein (TIGR00156 family)
VVKKLLNLLFITGISLSSSAEVLSLDLEKSYSLATVQMLAKMNDDDKVILEGHLIKNLGEHLYLFEDATGKVKIEITVEQFKAESFSPKNRMRVIGEIDKETSEVTIDIESIERVM